MMSEPRDSPAAASLGRHLHPGPAKKQTVRTGKHNENLISLALLAIKMLDDFVILAWLTLLYSTLDISFESRILYLSSLQLSWGTFVEVTDPRLSIFSEFPPFFKQQFCFGLDLVYVGGQFLQGLQFQPLNTVERFNVNEQTWEESCGECTKDCEVQYDACKKNSRNSLTGRERKRKRERKPRRELTWRHHAACSYIFLGFFAEFWLRFFFPFLFPFFSFLVFWLREALPPMFERRSGAAAAALDGQIYADISAFEENCLCLLDLHE